MPVLVSCQSVSKSYAARPLFRDITFGIEDNERLGLIGPNGAGKSTLFKVLAALETPDSGAVSARRGLHVGYVGQTDNLDSQLSVFEVLQEVLHDKGIDDHDIAVQVEIMIGRIGLQDKDQIVSALSGGWRKRLCLARELLKEPQLLLLDEPTNHLDVEGVLWLERLLENPPFAFAVITHDRYFLEKVTRRIIELSPIYPEGYLSVSGAYSDFLIAREEFLQHQANREHALAGQVKREVEWLRRGPQARTTKANYRIKEAGKLIDELGDVRFRNSQQDVAAGIDFRATGRKSRDLVSAIDIGKSFGSKNLFSGLEITLSPGTRLGLIGPNGSGKTTLLKILIGQTAPDTGAVRHTDGLKIVFFDQQREQLDLSQSLQAALCENGDTVVYRGTPMHVTAWAKRFLFRSDQLSRQLSSFSGGEQARVAIARLMLLPADVLILDEPTNDLDIPALSVLEESLSTFPGALVLVSHDRYMLDQVTNQILALDGFGAAAYYAGFDQWLSIQERGSKSSTPARVEPKPRQAATPAGEGRMTSTERREYKEIELRIEDAENVVRQIKSQMEDPQVGADAQRLHQLWESLPAAEAEVLGLYARWEFLEAKQAGRS